MLLDPKINHFFATTDMAKQRKQQKAFITLATGGPMNY
jgi:hemoglobin